MEVNSKQAIQKIIIAVVEEENKDRKLLDLIHNKI